MEMRWSTTKQIRHSSAWIGLMCMAAVLASCAGTVEVTESEATNQTNQALAATVTPQAAEPTAVPPASSESEIETVAGCRDGWAPLLAGTATVRISAIDASVFPTASVAVCEREDRLEFSFRELGAPGELRVSACQVSPETWRAVSGDIEFELVDERNSAGSALSVLNQYTADDWITMKLESSVTRTVERQNRLGAPFCEGSGRLCTTNVGTNEILNLRDQPSLEGPVLSEIPGGSCALWQISPASEPGFPGENWINVVSAPLGTTERIAGWVSADFVDVAPPDLVLDAYGVADVPFGTLWTEALPALQSQLGVPDETDTYDTCGVPGETQHSARWGNLFVLGHAPVDAPGTDAPVLTWGALSEGRFTSIGGLGATSVWSDVVSVLPDASVVDNEWGLVGQSHVYEFDFDSSLDVGSQWIAQKYFEFSFSAAESLQQIDQIAPDAQLGGVSAGHTWKDC